MEQFLSDLFSSENYMPHGHCYLWQPGLLWLHVISDSIITLAYFSIPITLIFFVKKRRDLGFPWVFVCFAIFILACGSSHIMEIVNVWIPYYWLEGIIKAITAIFSIVTAILLFKMMPLALALPSPSALKIINDQLRKEIEERVRIEIDLEHNNKELARVNAELNAFSYSVSHDLRAPLRSMDGFSQVLLEDYAEKIDQQGQDALHRIRKASQKMGLLIDDILRLSQVSMTNIKLEPVDLSQLAGEISMLIQNEYPERSVNWIIAEGMVINADRPLIKIVLQNLMENAWKFTGKTPAAEIRIGCELTDDRVDYFVEDNGAGFDVASAKLLFTPFQRFHQASDFNGTGIGLALVQRIIRRHQGDIWAKSEIGKGTTIAFCLNSSHHE